MSLTLENPLAVALVADSGQVEVEDLSNNQTNANRIETLPLDRLITTIGTIEPGDAREARWEAPQSIEQGRLTFEIDAHDPEGHVHRLTGSARVEPGNYSKQHPSEFLTVGGKRVEVVFIPAPDSLRPAPGVLLVHGHAHYARQMLRRAQALHRSGFAVMLMSQPGYGRSEGPPDYMGPRTIAAASAAFDRLARSPSVDSTRLGAWGFSRGATVVTLLMARRPDVRACVSQGGLYDLWAVYRGTEFDGIRSNIVKESGSDSTAWRARSPTYAARDLRGKLLILHGQDDRNVPFGQAKAFYQQLESIGLDVDAEFFPASQHVLPRDRADGHAIGFLQRVLEPAKAHGEP